MDKVFKYFNDFFKGLVGLIMGLLALSIVADFLFGPGSIDGINVIANITGVVTEFAGGGVIGLIGLLIVWNLISSK